MIFCSKKLPKLASILTGRVMLKTLTITVMMASTVVNATVNDTAKSKAVTSKDESYSLIVKFKDIDIHRALLSTPETTRLLSNKAKFGYTTQDQSSLAKKYNVHTTIEKSYGLEQLTMLSNRFDVELTHMRSMALNYDVINISDLDGRNIQSVIAQLQTSSEIEHVMVNRMMYPQTFNDPQYEQQAYFQSKSNTNPQGNFLEYSALNAVNNLGRKARLGIIDSGILPHEDVPEHVEGYDFLSWKNGDFQHTRDDDPTDFVDFGDGKTCSNQHGLAVTSNAAFISNNGIGGVGVVKTGEVEIIQARVLDCRGGVTSDIMDAVAWMAGQSVPGVPDITSKVDVINMSLGGPAFDGCSQFEQEIFQAARDAGVTVVVAAGNDGDYASLHTPASCNNVITVGATDDHLNDRASFSNYGQYVDVMAAGVSIISAWNPEYPNKAGELQPDQTYIHQNGTSMASPLTAGLALNLKMTHPALTPEQVESIIKSSTVAYQDDTFCAKLGCGTGTVQGNKVTDAITNVTTLSDYKKEHRYEGYNTPEEQTWLSEMDKFVNTCDLVKFTWGNLGFAKEGVSYKLYHSENGAAMQYIETIQLPQKVYNLPTNTELGVQACQQDECGEILTMSGQVTAPNACL